MAKKPKEATEPVAKRDTKLTTGATLKSLLKSSRALKEDLDELTTAHSAEVREAVDKKFLHKKAFNTIKMLDRMTPEKLADYMEHFDHYFEASGLEDRANSAQRLPMGDGAGEKDGEFQEDPPKDNVRNIAEKAGAGLPN
jgi:hypothetical protein